MLAPPKRVVVLLYLLVPDLYLLVLAILTLAQPAAPGPRPKALAVVLQTLGLLAVAPPRVYLHISLIDILYSGHERLGVPFLYASHDVLSV